VLGPAIVGLVDCKDDRHAGVACGSSNILVTRNETVAPIDDEDD
jgi:hypothetical protein